LHIGDPGLLRDPGRRAVLAGVTVLDVLPPPLRRRGMARARGRELAAATGVPDALAELGRRGVVSRTTLRAMGVPAAELPPAPGEWLVDPGHADVLAQRLALAVADHDRAEPLDRGLPLERARAALDLPHVDVVALVVREPLRLLHGRVTTAWDDPDALPAGVAASVQRLVEELDGAPEPVLDAGQQRLDRLGLGRREVAAAVRAGSLVDCGAGVLLTPAAVQRAVGLLGGLAIPFTVAAARDVWGTSRRVAVPLLELLDREGLTVRDGDGGRVLVRSVDEGGRLGA
jgi:selenocysteine-specific elongation factor